MNPEIEKITRWFLLYPLKIFFLLIFTFFLNKIIQLIIKKIFERGIKEKIEISKNQRVKTFISVFGGTARFIVWLFAFFFLLKILNIDLTPLLAGMGILGLAVGMAAREIIADFIAGFFILLEDQYHVGDKIKVVNLEGEVVEFTLRKTTIKDEQGFVHFIPNSQIKIISKKEKK